MSRLRKLSTSAVMTGAVVGAVAVLTAGTASAATITYAAGGSTPITYNCTFPAIPAQPVGITAQLSAPDSVAHGSTVTPTNVGGTATVSASVHSLLTAAGLDGIRGTATVPVTVSSGTLSSPSATGLNVPEKIYPTGGPITVNIAQVASSSIPNYTAPAAAGSATLKISTPITAKLQFHRASDNTWADWNMTCTLKTSPAQNTAFSPAIAIS